MASPLSTQIVNDLEQNFYWSYLSQKPTEIELVELEISVSDFLNYIEVDLYGTNPYPPEKLINFYYGMSNHSSGAGKKYFTFMLTNAEINNSGSMINLGIINYPDQYLFLGENQVNSSIDSVAYEGAVNMYKDTEIFSPYINQSVEIRIFNNHPLICSFGKEDFRNFIKDNISAPPIGYSQLSLVFRMGSTLYGGVDSDYKVETSIVVTKDNSILRLDAINYLNQPFKFKGLDVGNLCPPNY